MELNQEMPVFVKIEEYRDVIDIIELIKVKLNEAKDTLGKVNQLKNEEDGELELWNNELEDIESKIDLIDQSLFPAGEY